MITEIKPNRPVLNVTWKISSYCNYSCSYCDLNNKNGRFEYYEDLDSYINNLDEILVRYLSVGYKDFNFFFTGGEPTTWHNFIPIVHWIRETIPQSKISVETNLSRDLQWWQDFHTLFDDVLCSYHVEYATKDQFLEKAQYLCDKVNHLGIKLMMHDEMFWDVVDFGELLQESMPNYFIQWERLNGVPYDDEDGYKEEFLQENNTVMDFTVYKPVRENNVDIIVTDADNNSSVKEGYSIVGEGLNKFTGWDCDIGDHLFIGSDGYISLGSCGQETRVGHILNNIDEVGPTSVICKQHLCNNNIDVTLSKYAPDEDELTVPA